MATKRYRVQLPDDLAERCRKAGELIVQDLRNPACLADAMSASLSTHGAEHDPVLQANSKAGEVAFCLWAGFDPLYSVRWRHADRGYDVVWFTVRIDVKQTAYRKGCLIWPIGKNHLLDNRKKEFDVLVLATGSIPEFDLCGWTTKAEFLKNHHVADGSNGMTRGTRYMTQLELREMAALPAAVEWMCANDPQVVARSDGCHP